MYTIRIRIICIMYINLLSSNQHRKCKKLKKKADKFSNELFFLRTLEAF